ncbi:unnamed protein product, partial [Musa banksii]
RKARPCGETRPIFSPRLNSPELPRIPPRRDRTRTMACKPIANRLGKEAGLHPEVPPLHRYPRSVPTSTIGTFGA